MSGCKARRAWCGIRFDALQLRGPVGGCIMRRYSSREAMKKTLYQILGVDPKASVQEIEAAYSQRLEELKMATVKDSGLLVALQQAKAILSDPAQRAAHDLSIARHERGATAPVHEAPELTFLQRWGIWIAVSLFVVAGTGWLKRVDPIMPFEKQQAASRSVEHVRLPPRPAGPPSFDLPETIPVAAAPPVEAPPNPVAGEWACADAISGRTSKYSFLRDGNVKVAADDGQMADYKYELSGKSLKLADAKQTSTLAIEEMIAKKMILNTGSEGRRLVCRR
jgi:hypothetical protein